MLLYHLCHPDHPVLLPCLPDRDRPHAHRDRLLIDPRARL